jgi:hypothetical protein
MEWFLPGDGGEGRGELFDGTQLQFEKLEKFLR